MVRKTEKFDLFCEKYYVIPSLALAEIKDETTFTLWYDQLKEYPNILDMEIKNLEGFSLSGINQPLEFLKLQREVNSEIENNLFEASNEYELKKYFTYIKNKIENIVVIAGQKVQLLNRVNYTELENLDHLNLNEKAFRYLFYISMSNVKECFMRFLDVHKFIQEQEQLYLNNHENIAPIEIEQEQLYLNNHENIAPIEIENISDSISHKILVLYELGVVEYLQREYFSPQQTLRNSTDLARLISNIIGEPAKFETIRKHISGLHSRGKDNIVTKRGVRKVKSFLEQFSIPLKQLKDKD